MFPRYRSPFLQYPRIKGAPEEGGPWPALLLEMQFNNEQYHVNIVHSKFCGLRKIAMLSLFYTGEYIRHAPVLLGFLFKLYVLHSMGGIGCVLYNVPGSVLYKSILSAWSE